MGRNNKKQAEMGRKREEKGKQNLDNREETGRNGKKQEEM